MRNANWTRILTILLSLLALYAVLAVIAGFVQRFITPLLLVVLASIIAFVLTPVVDFIQSRFRVFRWMAILTTYLLLICLLGTLGYFMTTPLIAQTKALTDAIKDPTAKNLTAVTALDTSARNFADEAMIYSYDVVQDHKIILVTGQTGYSCIPNPGPCAYQGVDHPPGVIFYAPCYAAYFLGEMGSRGNHSQLWNGSGCTSSSGRNRLRFNFVHGHQLGPNPFKRLPPVTKLLPDLQNAMQQLSQTTLHAKPIGGKQPSRSQTSIPTTQIPSTYSKAARTDLATLQTDVSKAVQDVSVQSGTYAADSQLILRDARRFKAAVDALYTRVKSTPIVVLAVQNLFDEHHLPVNVGSAVSSAIEKVRGQTTTVLNNAVSILTGTINAIFDGVVILIMSLYLLADGGRFISWLMRLVPEDNREQAWFFVGSLNRVLGGYIRGQLVVAIMIGILAGVGCWIIGVPYALLLGIFAFLAESIPVMGPVIASVPAILVALFSFSNLIHVLIVAGYFLLIQQFEQNVVGPRITGHAVGIHPVVAMIAVIVGLDVGGIWGAFLAVPVTGVLFVLVKEGYRYFILQKPLQTAEMPQSLELEVVAAGDDVTE